MANAVEAGRAFIRYFIEDKDLRKGLKSIGGKLQKFGAIGAAATAPIVGGLTAAVAAFTNAGSAMLEMSQRTGFSVESLSELSHAANQSGLEMTTFEAAIRRMQAGVGDAERGTGTLRDAMASLGLNFQTIRGLSPEQQFTMLSSAIAGVEDPTLKAALAQDIFGKSGTQLLPLLTEGTDGINALRSQAHELGLTMSTETAASAEALGDKLAAAKAQLVQVCIEIGAAVAGPLSDFVAGMSQVLSGVIEFIRENPRMVKAIAAVSFAVGGASIAAIGLGTALTVISAHPIVAALAGIAALGLTIATYFGLASDAMAGPPADSAKILDAQRRQNQTLKQLYLQNQGDKLDISADTSRKQERQTAAANERLLSLQKQFRDERARQEREAADAFISQNERDLKEARELQRAVLRQTHPEMAARLDAADAARAESEELQRKWKLLTSISQLEQNAKLAEVRDMADAASRKLSAGYQPTEQELRAMRQITPSAFMDAPALPPSVLNVSRFAGGPIESGFAKDAIREIAHWTEATAENTKGILDFIRNNPAGGLIGGTA